MIATNPESLLGAVLLAAAPLQVQGLGPAGGGAMTPPRFQFPAQNPSKAGPRGSGGLDPLSPEVPGIDPSDAGRFDPLCNPIIDWTRVDLGVPPGGNIDALSDFRDVCPANGPASGLWPPPGRDVVIGFSVDRASTGLLTVRSEALTDGAASDVFGNWMTPQPGIAFTVKDGECLSVLPGPESDIDSILRSKVVRYPIFFSVDPPTAVAMGVSPADLLMVPFAGGPPVVALSEADLGLVPGDDIDALAMGWEGLVFSLRRGSPTAAATPLVGSGGLFTLGAAPWAFAWQCNLLATDDLDALAIGDPEQQHLGRPDPSKGPAVVLSDPTTGATDQTSLWRVFDFSQGQSFNVTDVEVGASLVLDQDFPVEVRLWSSPVPDPLAPMNLLASSQLTWPAGTLPGTLFSYDFPDVPVPPGFLWVELFLPPSPDFPFSGQVLPLMTPAESQPTFVSSPVQPQITDLDLIGLDDHALFLTLDGYETPDLILVTGTMFDGQPASAFLAGAQPGEQVELFLGLGGPGTGPCLPQFGPLCGDLGNPIQPLGAFPADPLGNLQLQLPVPPGQMGLELMTQALVPRGPGGIDSVKSNATRQTVK